MVDLTDVAGWIKRIVYRLDRIEGGWLLENASITRGRVRFIGGLLQGMAGAVFEWIGTFNLTGAFTAIGSSIFRGPVSITGETGTLDVEADASFGGDVAITENLDVTAETRLRGPTTVEDDVSVIDGGKVIAGVIVIDGTDGGRIAAIGADLLLVANFGHFIKLNGAVVAETMLLNGNLTGLGGATFIETVELLSNLDVPNLPTTVPGGVTPYTVLVGSNGRFYRGPAA